MYHRHYLLHSDWSHQWHELHVHGDCDQRWWRRCCIERLGHCRAGHSSGCAHGSVRCARVHPGCGVLDCALEQWRFGDHRLHGHVLAGFAHVYDGDDRMHGDWSHERHELHVHRDGDERGRHWFGIDGINGGCSGDGSGCTDLSGGHGKGQRSIGRFVDCSVKYGWQRDHWLHGDIVARLVHVHHCDNLVHRDRSHQWHLLHVHGDGHECGGYRYGVHSVDSGHPGNYSGCADWCVGCVWQHAGCGLLDCALEHGWFGDHRLHGDLLARCIDVYDHHGHHLHGDRSHQRHELHVHGDGYEYCGYWFGIECLRCGCSFHGSGCPHWCDRGVR